MQACGRPPPPSGVRARERAVQTTVAVSRTQATSQDFNTVVTLLDESPIRKEMANLRQLVANSNR